MGEVARCARLGSWMRQVVGLWACLVMLVAFGMSPSLARSQGSSAAPAESAQVTHAGSMETTGAAHPAETFTAAGAAHEKVEEGEPAEGPPEPPNFITVLLHTKVGGHPLVSHETAYYLEIYEKQIFLLLVLVILSTVIFATLGHRAMRPGKVQVALEMVVEGFYNFVTGLLGPSGKGYVPFLGSLFLFIFFNNLVGIIPLFSSPSSVFQTTVTLALIVFFYVHFNGIRESGFKHWFLHLMGSPKDTIGWVMAPLMFFLHVLGELAKPLSLSLRLFGNIMGEDILLGVFLVLGVFITSMFWPHPWIGIPLHLPFLFLALLTSLIQSVVFTLLSTIYLMMVLPHSEHEEHAEQAEWHPTPQPERPGMPEDETPHISANGAPFV